MFQAEVSNNEVPSSLWYSTKTTGYEAGGGRDILILAPNLSLPHPEAVARRPGQLTEEDKLKLQSQGLPHDCHGELEIIRSRCELDKKLKVIGVKSGKLLREDIIKHIAHLLTTTCNDGGKLYSQLHRKGSDINIIFFA